MLATIPHAFPHVITHAASATDANGHGTNLRLLLLGDESSAVWFSRVHLDTGAGRMDLFGAARSSDEEEDFQDIATLIHGQDLCHPWSNPFEVLGRLDDPDENNSTSRGSTIRVGGHQVADVGYLVGDTNSCRKQHDRAVRLEALAPIWPLNICGGH